MTATIVIYPQVDVLQIEPAYSHLISICKRADRYIPFQWGQRRIISIRLINRRVVFVSGWKLSISHRTF